MDIFDCQLGPIRTLSLESGLDTSARQYRSDFFKNVIWVPNLSENSTGLLLSTA